MNQQTICTSCTNNLVFFFALVVVFSLCPTWLEGKCSVFCGIALS